MDSVIKSDMHYQEHTGVLTHRMTQPSEELILNRNAELRKSPDAIRDLGSQSNGGTWGRQLANIPQIVYTQAMAAGFDLNSQDKNHAGQEMNRFLQTPVGKTCLIR